MSWQVWAILIALCVLVVGCVICAILWPPFIKWMVVIMLVLGITLFLVLNAIADAWRH